MINCVLLINHLAIRFTARRLLEQISSIYLPVSGLKYNLFLSVALDYFFPLPFCTSGIFFLHKTITIFYSCYCKRSVKITLVLLEDVTDVGDSQMMKCLGIIYKITVNCLWI